MWNLSPKGYFVDEYVVDRGAVYWRVVDGKSVVDGVVYGRSVDGRSVDIKSMVSGGEIGKRDGEIYSRDAFQEGERETN
ncbi:BnaA09g20340D [Brassica napus]|uniref:BnaA09g20340D protein n=1 Tax=Brassica napus TaxID=3708 RepID=A0A078FUJ0_BRANA|nr:BnaA09g20340D [Brassica napus]